MNKKAFNFTTIVRTYVNKLPPNFRSFRASILPFVVVNSTPVFLLQIDARYHELSDFGGGVKKSDASAIHTALREFYEESLGIFGHIEYKDIQNCFCLYEQDKNGNVSNLCIFVRLDINPNDVSKVFKMRYVEEVNKGRKERNDKYFAPNKKDNSLECCGIVSYNLDDFLKLLNSKRSPVYKLVKNFFNRATDWYNCL